MQTQKAKQTAESGAAMLIAIFALLLISVVAIALVVTSGTDTSLAANYRTSTGAYYAGVAGLEEARGRLLWKNPDFINKSGTYSNVLFDNSGVLPAWGLAEVVYIINPNTAAGETVDPTSANPAYYPDTEYVQEFPSGLGGAAVYQIPSVSPVAALSGPNYKWIRINAVTQHALNIDVNGIGSGPSDLVDLLYYDPAHVNGSNLPAPSLIVGPTPTPTSVQVLEVTAYAVLPNGGRRLLQYIVAPVIISPDATDNNFPAALTLDDGPNGNNVTFNPLSGFVINGADSANPPAPPGCLGSVSAIGYSSPVDQTYLTGQATPNADFPGALFGGPSCTPATPSLSNVALRQSWMWAATLDEAMQDIERSADVTLTGPATGADVWSAAPAMSASNPMTIVVNGDLTLNGSFGPAQTGYGLLLITGTLTYHPTAAWNGIILVVGKGDFVLAGHHGTGGIMGTVFVAQTRDSSGNLLPGNSLVSTFAQGGGSATGSGISYNSAWVKTSQGPLTYKILSFHEIPLPN